MISVENDVWRGPRLEKGTRSVEGGSAVSWWPSQAQDGRAFEAVWSELFTSQSRLRAPESARFSDLFLTPSLCPALQITLGSAPHSLLLPG